MTASLALTSPLDYQVIQRRSPREGIIPVIGSWNAPCERVEVRLTGRTMDRSKHVGPWLDEIMRGEDRGEPQPHPEPFEN